VGGINSCTGCGSGCIGCTNRVPVLWPAWTLTRSHRKPRESTLSRSHSSARRC
jgi:hypothetical protein